MILDAIIEDVKKITQGAAEMEFVNSSKSTKSRVFQAFGVNPIIAGEFEDANRTQAAIADELFCNNTVNPTIEIISQWMTMELPERFGDPDVVVWLEEARPNDPETTRAEAALLASAGSITKNELRSQFGWPPLPDGMGGDELVQMRGPTAASGAGDGGANGERRAGEYSADHFISLMNGAARVAEQDHLSREALRLIEGVYRNAEQAGRLNRLDS